MLTTTIILIGPMGAGKSTIGKRLARTLNREFVDADKELEQRTGVTIPLIFEMEGESGFRAREKALIGELAGRQGIVLATGGGVVMDADNRSVLTSSGMVIYLQASVESQLRRTRHDSHKRPMLQSDDLEQRLRDLQQLRDPFYRETADIVISTDKGSLQHSVREIVRQLELKAPY